ncbi:MAG: spondin domain-containing protein [Deltaproteobacteria bacterium]|jgi:hypothetical protein|nr:spondin domain-containing protein [Deltaproteobacteria bacterium]
MKKYTSQKMPSNLGKTLTTTLATMLVAGLASIAAEAAPIMYTVKITNGSNMPLSPAAIYVRNGANAASELGLVATPGFVKLCQMGDAATRTAELRMDRLNTSVVQSAGPIAPGASVDVEISVNDTKAQSLHFETMYGKSKDVCGLASVGSHTLQALKAHVSTASISHDRTVVTGVFEDAKFDGGYLNADECKTAKDAVSCLREISVPQAMPSAIRAFSGYLASVEMGLEERFGAKEVLGITLPTSGGIQIEVKLKH